MSLTTQITESVALIRSRWSGAPKVGIILGSGLGSLADEIAERVAIPYAEIPHFAQSTAIGHAGRLCCGTLAGHEVVAMQGRFHLYEGHPPQRAAYPIYVMQKLGIETLIVSNAAGGVNPQYAVGDLMAIDDHVNLMFQNPLVGVNDEALGPRFPDMSAPYDRKLLATAEVVARTAGFRLHRGVYVGMLGPTYETRGEYRLVRRLGDAAGMSTSPKSSPPGTAACACWASRPSPTSAPPINSAKPAAKRSSTPPTPRRGNYLHLLKGYSVHFENGVGDADERGSKRINADFPIRTLI